MLPTNYREGQAYPLIVDMRGTSSCDCFQRDPWDANQLLAQHGFVAFFPIVRAFYYPFNYAEGEAFHRFQEPGQAVELMVDDITSGVKELFKRGLTRPGMVGLLGFSIGGYGALQMAIHTDMFSCVVAAGAVYGDWSREYLLFSDGVDLKSRAGKTLWDDPDLYRRLSIIYNLNKIAAPVLLLVGDLDVSSVEESIEMFNGLRELRTPVQLVRYPQQGHQITGESLSDYWQRIVQFCDAHLKNSPAASRFP